MSTNWLSNRDIIRASSFSDKAYLTELYEEVKDYIYKSPTPIVSEWDESKHLIVLKIGSHIQKFKVSSFISPKDFITQIELWAYKYYPKYTIELTKQIPLDIEEKILAIKEKGISLDESLNLYKQEKYLERAVISRVFIPEDKFTIIVNDKKYVRLSGTIFNPMPLSIFLKQLRKIYSLNRESEDLALQIKTFIDNNSTLENKDVKEKEIEITYTGKRLKNFFTINRKELSSNPIEVVSPTMVRIGRFLISFDSEMTKEEMLLKLDTYRLKRSLNYD